MSDSIRPKTVSDTSRRGTRYTLERKSLEPISTSGDLPTVCETPSFGVTDVLICHTQAYAYEGRDLSFCRIDENQGTENAHIFVAYSTLRLAARACSVSES